MVELIAGVAVAFVAVGLVLQPLLVPSAGRPGQGAKSAEVEFEDITESASPKVQALLALKEIEFDRATGKLSDEDYEQLKAKYAAVALDAMRAEEAAEAGPASQGAVADAAEELVRLAAEGSLTVCPNCGPRPEADAAFCSDCGRALAKQAPPREKAVGKVAFCEACGTKLSAGAKFCPECGAKVGAVTAGSAG
jgi:DNA-directed RNA polymerase subunit RPC12/RpoP